MDVKTIYLLYNEKTHTRESIIRDLSEEGYPHHFMFGNVNPNISLGDMEVLMAICHEVWLFGDCSHMPQYKLASSIGIDEWQMG